MVAAMPMPATVRATRACCGVSAKTTSAATINGAGMSASWSPPPSMVALPAGAGQRRRSDLGGTVRTDSPAQPEAPVAAGASPRELRSAVRAEDELLLDLPATRWARPRGDALHRWLEQHLLLDGEGTHLFHRQRRSNHEVDERAEERRDEPDEHREEREPGRGGAPAGVADDVERERDPQHREVRDHHDDGEREQRAH